MKQKIFALTVLKFVAPMLLFGSTASAATTTQGAVAMPMTVAPYPYVQCMDFSNNLSRGSADRVTNYEVTKLQKFLKTKDNMYPEGWITGYFGPATERAVKRLQKKLSVEVTGRFDESTRRTLKDFTCGSDADTDDSLVVSVSNPNIACVMAPCGDTQEGVKISLLKDNRYVAGGTTDRFGKAHFGDLEPGVYVVEATWNDYRASGKVVVNDGVTATLALKLGYNLPPVSSVPVIDGVKGPVSLKVGENGTWAVSAHSQNNGALSYSVNWGDEYTYAMGATNRMINDVEIRQTSTFTHAYQRPGNYTVIFYVKNEAGEYAKSTMTVAVTPVESTDVLRVITPNGGEVWNRGQVKTIIWSVPVQPPCPIGVYCTSMMPHYYHVTLEPYYAPCVGYGAPCPMYAQVMPYRIADSVYGNDVNWQVGDVADYSRQIPDGKYRIKVCDAATSVCDSSDQPFQIFTIQYNQ